jgi:hypothetical protein
MSDWSEVLKHAVLSVFWGGASTVAGIFLIIRRKKYSEETVKFQNRYFRRSYGRSEVKHNETAAVVVGLSFIAIGIAFWITHLF